jgi:hypothetical protein
MQRCTGTFDPHNRRREIAVNNLVRLDLSAVVANGTVQRWLRVGDDVTTDYDDVFLDTMNVVLGFKACAALEISSHYCAENT